MAEHPRGPEAACPLDLVEDCLPVQVVAFQQVQGADFPLDPMVVSQLAQGEVFQRALEAGFLQVQVEVFRPGLLRITATFRRERFISNTFSVSGTDLSIKF